MTHFLLTIFLIFSLSSVHYVAMKTLRGKLFFAGAVYYVLRTVSCKWDGKEGGV